LVVRVAETFVSTFVIVTVTPGMAPPCSSSTWPEIVPRVSCAKTEAAKTNTSANAQRQIRDIMSSSLGRKWVERASKE
jgi:hypothetical protein